RQDVSVAGGALGRRSDLFVVRDLKRPADRPELAGHPGERAQRAQAAFDRRVGTAAPTQLDRILEYQASGLLRAGEQLGDRFGQRWVARAGEVLEIGGVGLLRPIGTPGQEPIQQMVRSSGQRPLSASTIALSACPLASAMATPAMVDTAFVYGDSDPPPDS